MATRELRLDRLATSLRTDRVVLRCFEPEDATELFDSVERSRDHLRQWLTWPSMIDSVSDAQAWTERVRPGCYDASLPLSMGIFPLGGGPLLGAAGLKTRSFQPGPDVYRWLDISYWIDVNALGQGYAVEAVDRLCRHGFEDVEAARVEVRIEPENERSIAVALSAGFTLEGVLRSILERDGELRDLAIYARVDAG